MVATSTTLFHATQHNSGLPKSSSARKRFYKAQERIQSPLLKLCQKIRARMRLVDNGLPLFEEISPFRHQPRSVEEEEQCHLAHVLTAAINNSVQLNLDITKIRDRSQVIKKTKNIILGHFDKPTTIVDSGGCILVWYLPQVLTKKQQICVFLADPLDQLVINTKPLIPKLIKSLKPGKKQVWCNNPKLFVTTLEGQELAPSIETFAVGWYPQGHAYASGAKPQTSLSI
ncbi:hypothetical protein P691DRAFT_790544 [Macrolepiota fuliginosa MF-IS2]|uniref:Uncharacterized protein n=1 Tax=Macrolepiota fuliginosa MF-IS2 TaxID=1400762 RepID=A0A9P5X2V3_9AGAR|nr:hypothetical protein P691DRAFT_790544 [Macrolepiota fuliginosa MF-IS2]